MERRFGRYEAWSLVSGARGFFSGWAVLNPTVCITSPPLLQAHIVEVDWHQNGFRCVCKYPWVLGYLAIGAGRS